MSRFAWVLMATVIALSARAHAQDGFQAGDKVVRLFGPRPEWGTIVEDRGSLAFKRFNAGPNFPFQPLASGFGTLHGRTLAAPLLGEGETVMNMDSALELEPERQIEPLWKLKPLGQPQVPAEVKSVVLRYAPAPDLNMTRLYITPDAGRAIVLYHHSASWTQAIEICDLRGGASMGVMHTPAGMQVIDVSPSGNRLLCVMRRSAERPPLVDTDNQRWLAVLDIENGKLVTRLIFQPLPHDNWRLESASLLDEDRILAAATDYAWVYSVAERRALWLLGARSVRVSTDHTLLMFHHVGLAVADSRTGQLLGIRGGAVSKGEFNPSRTLYAAWQGDEFQLLDAATGQRIRDKPMVIGHLNRRVQWLDDHHVLSGDRDLIDVRQPSIMWEYRRERWERMDLEGTAAAGRYFYLALGPKRQLVLTSVVLPHESALKAGVPPETTQADAAIYPNCTVSLRVDAPRQWRGRLASVLEAGCKQKLIKLAPGQPVQIVASFQPGKPQRRKVLWLGLTPRDDRQVSVDV
ncbi:MAG TPA: hypothetical protein VF184_06420, partial [Phycisphaeraceae bacterium]